MNKAGWLAGAMLILTACNDQGAWENSDYLIKTITVDYDNPPQEDPTKEDVRPVFQAAITEEIKTLKEKRYVHLSDDTLTWYQDTRPNVEKITQRRVKINGVWQTLRRDAMGDKVRVVSDKSGMCGFYYCTVTMELVPARTDPERLARMKAQFKDTEQQRTALAQRQHEQVKDALQHPPAGFLINLNNENQVVLPDSLIQSLQRWQSGIYTRRIGKLNINWQNAQDEIYSFSTPTQTLTGEFIIAPGEQGDIEFQSWLSLQERVIYTSPRGAIYYNSQGQAETLYYRYDEAAKRYVIGIANSDSFSEIITAYSMLRTMDPEFRTQNVIRMDDLALSQTALEARLGEKASDLFDLAQSHQLILDTINTLLADAARGEKAARQVHRVPAQLAEGRTADFAKMVIHHGTLRDVAAKTEAEYPGGQWHQETYIYRQNAISDGAYSFFLEKGGLVYEFYVDNNDYSQAERMLYLSVLRTLDATAIHTLPAAKHAMLVVTD
ncbi:hypothetical protein BN137_566 [Cronobacter condimenti 1330]|uniref:Lipoprotein n=2 Tax=Cronobacter condimenti 1330 TaxID=1073999 RepID=K8A6K2_9ENTR|nr:hypothetical protein BN137_566 [Cronobacter condimenti 1330]